MIHRWINKAARLLLIVLSTTLVIANVRQMMLPRHPRPPPDLKLRIIYWSEDSVKPDNRRIFFHETSGRNALSMRQSCAVESAAKNNPTRAVQIFMSTDHVNYSSPWIRALEHYSNVAVILVDEEEYFYQSPFEDWYQRGEWKKSRFRKEHMSDYIRILSLYKGFFFVILLMQRVILKWIILY